MWWGAVRLCGPMLLAVCPMCGDAALCRVPCVVGDRCWCRWFRLLQRALYEEHVLEKVDSLISQTGAFVGTVPKEVDKRRRQFAHYKKKIAELRAAKDKRLGAGKMDSADQAGKLTRNEQKYDVAKREYVALARGSLGWCGACTWDV